MARRWTCGLCGGDVIEGQRFTFIGGVGAVHVECLYRHSVSSFPEGYRDLMALLDVNEVLLYAITRFKEAEGTASSSEVKSFIAEARRDIERLAGRVASMLSGSLRGQSS